MSWSSWSDKPFSETFPKIGAAGRASMLTSTPWRRPSAKMRRHRATGPMDYALIADQHLRTLDKRLSWVWKSQVVRTELGRVIEAHGPVAATDLVRQIAKANPDKRVNAHEAAAGIRAGRLAARRREKRR